jgi:glucose-6-phosphate 1-dehydrogenase
VSQTHSADLVFFGGTGDLAMRKLIPAIYAASRGGKSMDDVRVIGCARQNLSTEQYHSLLTEQVPEFLGDSFDAAAWAALLARVSYVTVDAAKPEDFARLGEAMHPDVNRARVYYLATTPTLFTPICQNLAAAGLVTPASRVVLEKPLGRDLASSRTINDAVGAIFAEHQIYRIDHYLGKETVQNLLALRFGNAMFEPLWSRAWIRDVQITIAEQVGVGGRGEFYDNTGALRDMVQNHLLQLLCIVAMEPPATIDADAVRDEKVQVLRALKPYTLAEVQSHTVRGQYRAGAVAAKPVPGYQDEEGITSGSRTETFVALKAELANWRWAGVPFYLRTGKRMEQRLAEIVINFKQVPHSIFESSVGAPENNRMIIRLQPDEGLTLQLQAKTPGEGMKLQEISLNLNFADTAKARRQEAYERLLIEVIQGRLTLFVRRDEQEAAWKWVEPIMAGWDASPEPPKPYNAGTWGPAASAALVGRDGSTWPEES